MLGATGCFGFATIYALMQCALTHLVHHSATLNPYPRRAPVTLAVASTQPGPVSAGGPGPLRVAINGARTQQYGVAADSSDSALQIVLNTGARSSSRSREPLGVIESDSAAATAFVSSAHREAMCRLHTSRCARLLHALRCLLALLVLLLMPLGALLCSLRFALIGTHQNTLLYIHIVQYSSVQYRRTAQLQNE